MAKVHLAGFRAISNAALNSKDLPTRIKVLDWGLNKTLKGDVVVDQDTTAVFAANQTKIGRERAPIDFDHNTVRGTDAHKDLEGKPPVIFGYGTPRVIPGDGVWFEDIQWTPDGQDNARNFHDLSPATLLDEDNRLLAIHSCALTPAGAVQGLTFYSAFDSVEASSDPDAYKETMAMLKGQRLLTPMKEHFNYFRQHYKLAAGSTDDEVAEHLGKTLSKHFDATADASGSMQIMKALNAVIAHKFSTEAPTNTPPIMNSFTPGGPEYQKLVTDITAAIQTQQDAKLTTLTAEIDALKTFKATKEAAAEKAQRAALVAESARDGKVIPLTAELIEQTPIVILTAMVAALPKQTVPVKKTPVLRPLNADGTLPKGSMSTAAAAINAQIEGGNHRATL